MSSRQQSSRLINRFLLTSRVREFHNALTDEMTEVYFFIFHAEKAFTDYSQTSKSRTVFVSVMPISNGSR